MINNYMKKRYPTPKIYIPKHPEKWITNGKNIVARSNLESKIFRRMEMNSAIVELSSEEVVIPYISPVDGKVHRYFMDLYIKVKDRDGKFTKYLIEIKPDSQTKLKKKKKINDKYIQEVKTYAVNQAKWDAAVKYCKERGMKFRILTDKFELKEHEVINVKI